MRIAFFSDNFYPELSGITDTIITTGKELRARGHDIVYVAPYYAPNDYATASKQYPETPGADTIDGIPIVRIPSVHLPGSPTGQSRFAFPFGQSFTFLDSFKPDIIHTQSPYSLGFEAHRASKRYGVPLVGTNHTAIEDFFPFGALMRRYDAWYYNHCDFVTTPYEGLITRMREAGFRKPAKAVPNPAELELFKPSSTEERRQHCNAYGFNCPVVLYVGRLGLEKRVDVTIRAIALLVQEFPDISFVATGHGAAERSLKQLSQELGIAKHVQFMGFVPRQTLPHFYKAADVFAMMSTSDSQSIALMQAYACALPAVCARSRGLPDYTPEGAGFLVRPGDHVALAEKLGMILRDETLRGTMGRKAAEFVKQFSPEKVAAQWEDIYKEALSSR